MTPPRPLSLFEGYGIELEYMIVDRETLDVRPLADRLLAEVGGGYELEVELGPIAWSNELALHVIELKTNGPSPTLEGLAATFQEHVGRVNALLEPMGSRLLPGAMHPWMDPERELALWPHEHNEIYRTFDRIFDCRGHGWANLQSMHVNLPFSNDEELARLHDAIRLALPLLPALAASSPFVEGQRSPALDARLIAYRDNARRVPSVSGLVVPERVASRASYEAEILERIYGDLAPHDPEGVLRHEWVNARGCIARFDRMTLEIRVLDLQECPAADLAVAAAVVTLVRALVEERLSPWSEQQTFETAALSELLVAASREAGDARVDDARLLRALGYPGAEKARLRDVWGHLIDSLSGSIGSAFRPALDVIVSEGCLAERLARAAGPSPPRARLHEVYSRLAECLSSGRSLSSAG